jgi:hypothetical protein
MEAVGSKTFCRRRLSLEWRPIAGHLVGLAFLAEGKAGGARG